MTRKRFALRLVAIVALLAITSPANAEILALDCSGASTTVTFWVDFDKSAITEKLPDGSLATESANITATAINWKHVNASGTYTEEIDRTSGDYHYSIVSNFGQYFPGAHLQCNRSSTPFPATKF